MQNNQVQTMQEMQARKKRRGFTLAELVVVVAIIAVLAVIFVPRIATMTEKARVASFESNYATLQVAINAAIIEQNGVTPTAAQVSKHVSEATTQDVFTEFANKPGTASYTWDESNGKLEAILQNVDVSLFTPAEMKGSFGSTTGKTTYTLTFTP